MNNESVSMNNMASCHGAPGIEFHLSSQGWMPALVNRRVSSSTAGLSALLWEETFLM
jgi:hypothetical protein